MVDPKAFDEKSFVHLDTDVCIVPPNSFALARSVEYFRIPRDVITICLGKSTYARCGIIVNVTAVRAGMGRARHARDIEHHAVAGPHLCERGPGAGALHRWRRGVRDILRRPRRQIHEAARHHHSESVTMDANDPESSRPACSSQLGHHEQCPLCGGDNRCRVAKGHLYKGACWCHEIVVPSQVLQRLAEEWSEPACLCRVCLETIARISRELDGAAAIVAEVRRRIPSALRSEIEGPLSRGRQAGLHRRVSFEAGKLLRQRMPPLSLLNISSYSDVMICVDLLRRRH